MGHLLIKNNHIKKNILKALDFLEAGKISKAEESVKEIIGLFGSRFSLKVIGKIDIEDKRFSAFPLETLGMFFFSQNAYKAAGQTFFIRREILSREISNKKLRVIREQYQETLSVLAFFMDFAIGMHNWRENEVDEAIACFNRCLYAYENKESDIAVIREILIFAKLDKEFRELLKIKDITVFIEQLNSLKSKNISERIDALLKIKNPLFYTLSEVIKVVTSRATVILVFIFFLSKIILVITHIDHVGYTESSVKDLKKFLKFFPKNKVFHTIIRSFILEYAYFIGAHGNLKRTPPKEQISLMDKLKPLTKIYLSLIEGLYTKEERGLLEKKLTSMFVVQKGFVEFYPESLKRFQPHPEVEGGKAELKRPEGGRAEYVVFLSRPSGNESFLDKDTNTENQVHQKYSTKKEKFDIFIYEQNVYKKVMDEGKAKMISLNPSISFRGLLILFLKYKGSPLPYVELYHKAFSWKAFSRVQNVNYDDNVKLPPDVMNTLKNAVNELKKEFENIKGFSIPRAKNSQYKCEGDFNFCLILKKSTNEHYTMLFEKFKIADSIPEEV